MILPIQASLERVPNSLINASHDLGANKRQTFYKVILPLALPGVIAGSIFTFSLTLGDYIIPYIIGTSKFFIGQAVYTHQGTAGNIPSSSLFISSNNGNGYLHILCKKNGSIQMLFRERLN